MTSASMLIATGGGPAFDLPTATPLSAAVTAAVRALGGDVVFGRPELLWLALVAIALAALAAGTAARLDRQRRRFARPGPGVRRRSGVVRASVIGGALLLLSVAASDPRWGERERTVEQRGTDIVVLLDVSRSMLARDATPSRLARARQYARDLVRAAPGRTGLVLFAGATRVAVPLTVDDRALLLALDLAEPEDVARGGSLVGDGLRAALEAFPDDVGAERAIVLLSDGEDMASLPEAAAARIAALEIRVHAIGIGDAAEGATIPTPDGPLVHDGEVVRTRMRPDALRRIALETGGTFVPAGTRRFDVAAFHDERLRDAGGRSLGERTITALVPRFHWFLLPALLLLAGDAAGDLRRRAPTLRRGRSGGLGRGRPARPERRAAPGSLATLALSATAVLVRAGGAGGPPPTDPPVAASPARGDDPLVETDPEAAARAAAEVEAARQEADRWAARAEGTPDDPRFRYNEGVAAFRARDLDRARAAFRDVHRRADDPALRARAAYNRAVIEHGRAIAELQSAARLALDRTEAVPEPAGSPEALDGMQRAAVGLREALDAYRSALRDDPSRDDARLGGERARRVLDEVERLLRRPQQQDQEQQQPRPGDDGDRDDAGGRDDEQDASDGERSDDGARSEQQDESGDATDQGGDEAEEPGQEGSGQQPEGRTQQGRDQEGQGQQGRDQQEQDRSGEERQGDDATSGDRPGEQGDRDGSQGDREGAPEADGEAAPGADAGADSETGTEDDGRTAAAGRPAGLTRAEAERLLQLVRDKERRRRETLAEERRRGRPPVERDW